MKPISNSRKTFAEFFAGIGLVAEGLRPSGWTVSYANDIDSDKHRLYTAFHSPAPYFHRADVWETDAILERLGQPPMLATASFPCTDLSTAGHYLGFAGKESSALFGFCAVLRRLGSRRPPIVMLENVPGFLTARQGQDFSKAATELASLGYYLDPILVDAKHFVPQSRPRLFIVCRHADAFPRLGTATAPVSDARPKRLLDKVKQIQLKTGWDFTDLPRFPQLSIELVDVIDFEKQPWWCRAEVNRHVAMMDEKHLSRVEKAKMKDDSSVFTAYRRIREKIQRLEVRDDDDGLAGCLRTIAGGSSRQIVLVAGHGKIWMRWMSPAEYARLQGYDRPLPKYGTGKLLTAFGDAVCVPVISWIDRHLLSPAFDMLMPRAASVA